MDLPNRYLQENTLIRQKKVCMYLARSVVFVCSKKVNEGKNAAAHEPVGFVDAHQDLFIARTPSWSP